MRSAARPLLPRRAIAVAAASSALFSVAGARGEEPSRFDYARGAGAESCPDESALRQAVATRLGKDPFDDDPRVVKIAIAKTRRGYSATIQIRDADGTLRGERALASTATSCTELGAALAAALSVVFEAPHAPPPEPAPLPVPPAPTPSPEALAVPPPTPEPSSPAAPRTKLHVETSLASGGAFGAAPSGAVTFLGSVAIAGTSASIGLEGRTDLPASAAAPTGTVSSSLVMGTLVPCVRRGALGACALGAVGALRGKGEGVQSPTSANALYVAAGVRVMVEVPIDRGLYFRAGGDLETTLKGVRLLLDGQEAWTTPPLSGVLWAGVAFHSP